MITVTYKNVLKPSKKQDDFMDWLKIHWPQQQQWGAKSVKLWNTREGNRQVLFCQYTVENIDRWTEKAAGPSARKLVRSLGEVVEMDRMTIKISVPQSENA